MKFVQTLLALALASTMVSASIAQASSTLASPVLEMEVFTQTQSASGWKVNLSNDGTREASWNSGTSSWDWGSLKTSATPLFNQNSKGDWALNSTQPLVWSDAGQNFEVTIAANDAYGNLDPLINYTMSVKNKSGGAKTFQKIVTAPIVPPISGANVVRASVSGSLTDATGNGITITPKPNRNQDTDNNPDTNNQAINNGDKLQLFLLSTTNKFNAGNYTNAGVDVGGAETHVGPPDTSFAYGAYNDGPIAGPVGSWKYMQTRTRFTLTGNGDKAVIKGYAEISAVPEAKTYGMMLVGLGLVGFIVRRRHV